MARGRKIAAGLVLVLGVAVACDSTGAHNRGSCRRLDDILDDASDGSIESAEQFRERLTDDLVFEDDSALGESRDRLLQYIDDGDEEGAAAETAHLQDLCLSVLDS